MPKTYRGRLPKPDNRGYVRPEIGDKRFNLGNVRDVSTGQMERRLSALRDLFDRQCKHQKIDFWSAFILPFAKKVAAGERLTLHVSDYARSHNGQASEEAQGLQMLRDLGLDKGAAVVRNHRLDC